MIFNSETARSTHPRVRRRSWYWPCRGPGVYGPGGGETRRHARGSCQKRTSSRRCQTPVAAMRRALLCCLRRFQAARAFSSSAGDVASANEARSAPSLSPPRPLTSPSQELSHLFGLARGPREENEVEKAAAGALLTHVDKSGRLAMVDVGHKSDTQARLSFHRATRKLLRPARSDAPSPLLACCSVSSPSGRWLRTG